MKRTFNLVVLIFISSLLGAQDISYDSVDAGNPLLPGYFADPTIKKFADTYYLYTTTDGIKLASGEPQVWISKDFVNWFNYEMDLDIPEGLTNVWAPDVLHGKDGKYYYFMGNCQMGCNIYGYTSDSPMGPWTPLNDGGAVIKAGTGAKNMPALDAQFFMDNGSMYSFFGTWCHLFGGIGWAKFKTGSYSEIEKSGVIPMQQVTNAFEAAYPLIRNGKYFLMYSSGDCRLSTYAVHYSVGNSPEGLFRYGSNSPILQSNENGTVDSPGHHSVLAENGNYYILYHRHDNPHSSGGMFRQVCADPLEFENDSVIQKVTPSHKGIGYLGPNQIPYDDLALNAPVSASSFYHLVSKATTFSNGPIDYKYLPRFAVDNNNGTLWKAGSCKLPQSLMIDLGKVRQIKRVLTQFEYPTFYYQYKIEASTDRLNWQMFADKTQNRRSGSPMIDDHTMDARYVRLTVTGTEKAGLLAAVWNIKVYDKLFDVPAYQNRENEEGPGIQSSEEMLVDFDVSDFKTGQYDAPLPNKGALGGEFSLNSSWQVTVIDGVKALAFDGHDFLKLSNDAPESLSWNAPFTVAAWVNNPEVAPGECLMTWNSRDNMLQGSYAALMYGSGPYGAVAHGDGLIDMAYEKIPVAGKWHHIALSFDGMKEVLYVDGIAVQEQPMSLFVKNGAVLIGGSGAPDETFSGYIANIQLFGKALNENEIGDLMKETKPKGTK